MQKVIFNKNYSSLTIILFLCFHFFSYSQKNESLGSTKSNSETLSLGNTPLFLKNCHFDGSKKNTPYYSEKISINNNRLPNCKLNNIKIRPLSSIEKTQIEPYKNFITNDFDITLEIGYARNEKIEFAKIMPIRLNSNNVYEYLESYTVAWDYSEVSKIKNEFSNQKAHKTSSASVSVLATGKWYKIGLTKNGVYKLDKSFFTKLGIDVSTIDPRNLKIYGNGGKLLSEKNSDFKFDDLIENAISVVGENDGVFNNTDYVLFYGQSTDSWVRNPINMIPYHRQIHSFSDTSFYFINVDINTSGKRILQQNSLSNTANKTTNSQDYYDIHEVNTFNAIKSGREFYGEKFDNTTSYNFSFLIPDGIIGDSVYVKSRVLSRCDVPSNYLVSFASKSFNISCAPTNLLYYISDLGFPGQNQTGGILTSNFLNINVTKQTSSAIGWLDYVEINARRNLTFNSSQFTFRDRRVVGGAGTYAKYMLTNTASSFPLIWDVTNPLNVKNQSYTITSATNFEYNSKSDSINEYVIFNENIAFTPTAIGLIKNQNLHGILQADYVIVTHPLFLDNAYRLAKLHSDYDSLTYAVVTTTEVYNEFSSGTPDIGAIREFVKMLYFKPTDPTKATKYLLLLGDGSYKNREISSTGNSAMIPTYQTFNSTSYTDSFVTDDYFAMMDNGEGDLVSGDLPDIGVGRFPVKSKNEADAVTSKIEQYYKRNFNFDPKTEETSCDANSTNYPQGDWRNWVTFVSDDEDNNEHFNQSDALANPIYNNNKNYNVNKIHADSYLQFSTPGGDRYPDAVNDINRSFEKGSLIWNYTGHGGELGLGAERFIEVPQILDWKNINNLPLMITATCEFSRFDDPDRTSAGEYCLLNPNGGAVGLMTTVRLAFSGLNFALNTAFYSHALTPMTNGKMPHLGDLYRLTKRDIGFNRQYMNFVILGDPALKLAYPEQKVFTTSINSQTLNITSSDTLKALKKMTITGFVGDKFGNKLTNFNGVVFPTVFDKEIKLVTLANDPNPPNPQGSLVDTFKLQKNIIYKGKSTVNNGEFSFSFLVPKDISYSFGKGKITYYAHNGITDANGYYDKIVVGGSETNAFVDNKGPEIKLFLNDEKFVTGGTTNETPKIFALITDSSGINTVGNGIGHDVVAILDEKSSNPIVLNDYYVANLNTYQSGKIRYGLNTLAEGKHQLSLKVWDVQNNSSTAYTDFIVAKEANLALSHILNYPNPFTTKTKFFIEHNQCCVSLKVLIQIYTISGKSVKSIHQTINNEGFRFDGIEWDGKDDFGDKLARGVYIYRVSVVTSDNKKAEKIEKLVILN